ncbi:uncharacterized protein CLUP02_03303 [Colletotrichum lupini]|uniref:Uncharacterized protein n=1 Tax=Colletotrichum lupini TaxID=145971 RepID=A0A9Q8SI53_9PEZI|nr:uncharacterized protein CLUP02_03303 [Colletotrichum lupini]UQC77832.1 hypothetical protein CLUP02_03303 [Colletotrichum lupini]
MRASQLILLQIHSKAKKFDFASKVLTWWSVILLRLSIRSFGGCDQIRYRGRLPVCALGGGLVIRQQVDLLELEMLPVASQNQGRHRDALIGDHKWRLGISTCREREW